MICLKVGCGSLCLFPSAAGWNFSEDGYTRPLSASIVECQMGFHMGWVSSYTSHWFAISSICAPSECLLFVYSDG